MKLELASFTLVALAGLPLTGCSALPFDDPFETIEADGVPLVHETKAPIGVTDIGHYGPVVLTNGCLGIEIFGPEGLYVGGDIQPTEAPLMLPMVAPVGTKLSKDRDEILVTTEGGHVYRLGETARFSAATRMAGPEDDEGDIVETACGTRNYIYLTQW